MPSTTFDTAPRVNGTRLWSRLMAMGEIGATAHGGCNRQALTDGDLEGRELFSRWAAAAGCAVRVDAIGNLFARRAGRSDALPVVLTGSHLDTQPTGGKFDGIYGVLAGLEVVESLNERSISTQHPIEVAVWCNEEGCRFPAAMMGSAVWSGRMPLESAYALTDRDGRSVRQELERLGVKNSAPGPRQAVKAALEVHIEQGPVLEQQSKTIGIVTGVQHMSRSRSRRRPVRKRMRGRPPWTCGAIRCACSRTHLPALLRRGREAPWPARAADGGRDRDTSELAQYRAGVSCAFSWMLRHPDTRLTTASLREEVERVVDDGPRASCACKGAH